MAEKQIRFADLLTLHVSNTIKKQFVHEQLNPDTLRGIRDCVRKTITEVFMKSKHQLSTNAMNWVANQYFKSIQLNGETVNDLVVINEYKLDEMSFSDIQLMRNLFNETAMSSDLEAEYRRRNAS